MYLKYKKIVIWQIKVFFKFLGVIKINFILLVQPSILQPYILQNISFPRIFSLKKGATLLNEIVNEETKNSDDATF